MSPEITPVFVKCNWFDPHRNRDVIRYYGPFNNTLLAEKYLNSVVLVNGCDGQHSITSYVTPPYQPIKLEGF